MAHEQTPVEVPEAAEGTAFMQLVRTAASRKVGTGALALMQVAVLAAGSTESLEHLHEHHSVAAVAVEGGSNWQDLLRVPGRPPQPREHKKTIVVAKTLHPELSDPKTAPAIIPHVVRPQVHKPVKPPKTFASRLRRPTLTAHPAFRAESQQLVDIGWPDNNCQATIPSDIRYGIVGVNHGKPFTANDCLKHEASEFEDFALYVNTANPNAESPHDYGYNAGKYAVKYAFQQGIYRPTWWLDVETANSWSKDVHANVQSIIGTMAGITDAAEKLNLAEPKFGVYSAISTCKNQGGSTYLCGMYPTITGNWKATWNNKALPGWQAANTCKTGIDFTGGGLALAQGQENGLDTSDLCSDFSLQDVL